jgi:CheY-like chemotaxis protein
MADNGRMGVEMVEERMQAGEKPFDLIFMDMFMPVMDGIEAATRIIAMRTGTPIVAVTANVMASELENYRKHGMPDCLSKPFTSQELWHILLKYLTPVSSSVLDKKEQAQSMKELLDKLQANFVKNSQTVYVDIIEAIAMGDIKLAHRLAHTLKGNAGQIGKTGLQNIAAEIEGLLKGGMTSVPEEKMNLLKNELALVLEELRPLLEDRRKRSGVESVNIEQIPALLEKIESMIENINPKVADMIDDIRAVPGTEEFVRFIEDYDFESAASALVELKRKYTGAL